MSVSLEPCDPVYPKKELIEVLKGIVNEIDKNRYLLCVLRRAVRCT